MSADTTLIFDDIAYFRRTATDDTFNSVFGQFGNHLWSKFKEYDHDVIRLYESLDFENRKKLADYFAPHQTY